MNGKNNFDKALDNISIAAEDKNVDKLAETVENLKQAVYDEVISLDFLDDDSDENVSLNVYEIIRKYSYSDPLKALSELLQYLSIVQQVLDNISMTKLELMKLKEIRNLPDNSRANIKNRFSSALTYTGQCFYHVKAKYDFLRDAIETVRSINTTSRGYKYSNREITNSSNKIT